ncbi:PA2928 family protein [Saccharibacillus qingshengii]|uniref:PA2928 family protein n=1 Tax=Saccharibacillus qingshengii TaxID=1763540 RepID=UPI0015582C58|nr:PA2928 family protein [Saccharibacillus qingshengii]
MEPSLLEKIELAFHYNDATWHNVFLTLVYLLVGIAVVVALIPLVRPLFGSLDHNRPRRHPLRSFALRSIVGLVLLAFPLALFLLLSVILLGAGNARVISDPVSYEQSGRPVSVMLVDKFLANTIENGTVSGTSQAYAYAIDTESGTPIWKTGIGSAYEPVLLGQTPERIVLCDGAGLTVLGKAEGEKLADRTTLEQANVALQGIFPEDPQSYAWDDKNGRAVMRGLDGALYAVDPDTLQGEVLDGEDPAAYFDESAAPQTDSGRERLGLIRSKADPESYLSFLNEQQAEALKQGTFGSGGSAPASGAAADPRKRIYAGQPPRTGAASAAEWTPVGESVFLNGGFLIGKESPDDPSSDPYRISEFPSYDSLVQAPDLPDLQVSHRKNREAYEQTARELLALNGASEGPPFRYADPESGKDRLLIVHDAAAADNPNLLLSAFDPEKGSLLWTADTRLKSIDGFSLSGGMLAVEGRAAQESSYLILLSLTDGHSAGYDFQYDRILGF